jgi:hypothetical protein
MATTALEHPNHVKTHLPPEAHNPGFQPLATFLGLFSLGLGFAELLKPSAMQRATGVHNHSLLRGYGLREIISGIGILSTNRPVLWLWSRVVGDVIDMATLASTYANGTQLDRERAVQAAIAVAPVAILDVVCAAAHTSNPDFDGTAV